MFLCAEKRVVETTDDVMRKGLFVLLGVFALRPVEAPGRSWIDYRHLDPRLLAELKSEISSPPRDVEHRAPFLSSPAVLVQVPHPSENPCRHDPRSLFRPLASAAVDTIVTHVLIV